MFNIWKLGDSELFTFDDTFGVFFSLFEIFKYQTELMKQKMTRILEKKKEILCIGIKQKKMKCKHYQNEETFHDIC